MEDVRVTVAVAAVLRAFLDEAGEPLYGYELMGKTGFASGKMYPILRRLSRAGWLVRMPPKENVSSVSGGPPRIGYRLDPAAVAAARHALAELSALAPGRSPGWIPEPAG